MDISSISKYYELLPLKVTPDQLLLDPRNPRIVLDVDTDRKFSEEEIVSKDVQEYILSVINKQAHHIAELIRGISASGFIDKGDDMIVRRTSRSSKYIVIEGNRRTTAIKHLLEDPNSLKPAVLETLASLNVKEFVYRPNREFSEEAVIDILLGTIHVNGRLPWGALERAYYIYASYLREMKKYTPDWDNEFEYVSNCASEIAAFFNLSTKDVRRELTVYRVYEQLKNQSYEVFTHHFSLIDMAVRDKELCKGYFELNGKTFRLSSTGLKRFNKLCIDSRRPIKNPKDFRSFAKIYRQGTEHELELVESGEDHVDIVLERIRRRKDQRQFLAQLQGIKEHIEDLRPADFRESNAEIEMIRRIKRLVDNKLFPLTRG
jgi:hypothetical protein